MSLHRAAAVDDLWGDELVGVVVDGVRVLLVKVDEGLHVYEDRCAHQAVPLSIGGRLRGNVLTCPVHEWQFDVRTGAGINPCGVSLCALPFVVRDGVVLVDTAPAHRGAP